MSLKMVKYHQCPTRRILSSLILAIFWSHLSQEASVNLTVEEGINLVDENCPGIVTLFCEGVDINQLRWRYNGDTNIVIYSSDSSPSQTQISQAAFLSVELVTISQNSVDPNRANFTSVLTANLSRLQSDNVMEIECGDATTFQIEPVDVQIIDRSRDPSFSMVTAEYQSQTLSSVQVQWRKSENICPADYVIYQVSLTAGSSISVVDHNNCSEDFCLAIFKDIDGEIGTIKVSILATNKLGRSELICYPYTIYSSTQQYYVPRVSYNNNQFKVECVSTALSASGQTCSVRYTTDPLFTGLSDETTSMLDTPFSIPGLSADTIYYFEFSLAVNSSLQVFDRISFTNTGLLPVWKIAIIIVVIVFGISTVTVVIVVIVARGYRKRKRNAGNMHRNNPQKPDSSSSIDHETTSI